MLDVPPTLTIRRTFPRPAKAAIDALAGALTGQVADALGGLGALDASIKPLDAAPAAMRSVIGPAFPCTNSPGDQLGLVGAMAFAEPGDVLVVGTEAYLGTAVIGDLMTGMVRNRGVAGVVTDGAVRDTPGIIELGLPVYAAGVSPNSPQNNGPGTVGLPIAFGGVTINPGDVIVGDTDGIVVVPAAELETVTAHVKRIREAEAALEAEVKGGLDFVDAWHAKLEPGLVRYLD